MTLNEALNNEEIAKQFESAANMEEILNILKKNGVETTEEDLIAMLSKQEGELSDENLEEVSGGVNILAMPLAATVLCRKLKNWGLIAKLLGMK